jgi:uracil-DNA glycosylase
LELTADYLRWQLKLHLEGLKAAGVEFLPLPAGSFIEKSVAQSQPAPKAPPVMVDVAGRFSFRVNSEAPKAEPAAKPTSEPAAATDDPKGRRIALMELATEIAKCGKCAELFATRTQTVFGTGPVGAAVCFVGEAPGKTEDATGQAFVGDTGQLLKKIIAACQFQQDEVYLCNVLKCRPPNRFPTEAETSNCGDYLKEQIRLIGPKYIVALGLTAANHLLETQEIHIQPLRGKMYQYQGIPLICTVHPEEILKKVSLKKECWDDMKMLLTAMGRPIPSAK